MAMVSCMSDGHIRRTNAGQALAFEYDPQAALSHFEPADLLDALSIGVVLLDAQLCVIYANEAAQNALALRFDQARGRPIGDFLDQSSGLVAILRSALEPDARVAGREHSIRPFGSPPDASTLGVTITRLRSQVTGTHLLLQFAAATQTQSTSAGS
jgi:nitrogen-specific signal transduction histidine kinase